MKKLQLSINFKTVAISSFLAFVFFMAGKGFAQTQPQAAIGLDEIGCSQLTNNGKLVAGGRYGIPDTDIAGQQYDFALYQNAPNPFKTSTVIVYEVQKPTHVKLSVFDQSGREIQTIVDEYKNVGCYSVELNGQNFSAGIYYYRLESAEYSITQRMIMAP